MVDFTHEGYATAIDKRLTRSQRIRRAIVGLGFAGAIAVGLSQEEKDPTVPFVATVVAPIIVGATERYAAITQCQKIVKRYAQKRCVSEYAAKEAVVLDIGPRQLETEEDKQAGLELRVYTEDSKRAEECSVWTSAASGTGLATPALSCLGTMLIEAGVQQGSAKALFMGGLMLSAGICTYAISGIEVMRYREAFHEQLNNIDDQQRFVLHPEYLIAYPLDEI